VGRDVGLEEVPQYGGVEEGRVNETAVRPEGPGGLDGDDGGGENVPSRIFTQE